MHVLLLAFSVYLGIITGFYHKINPGKLTTQFVVFSCLSAKKLQEVLKLHGFVKVVINAWHRQVAFKLCSVLLVADLKREMLLNCCCGSWKNEKIKADLFNWLGIYYSKEAIFLTATDIF